MESEGISDRVGLQIDAHGISKKPIEMPNLPKPLSMEEKKYLLAVERGDAANVKRIIQKAYRNHHIDINCVDSFGRSALTVAIDTENLEMVELLIVMGVDTKDALLQAINVEFVEAVEILLEHEELVHKDGEAYSWEKVDRNISMFSPDITPLVLAAHRNNYEIIKILLDRGASLPMPHDTRCSCQSCIRSLDEDSLRHSMSRLNEYRALASPSLIALSATDPILTAFQLSWQLRNLAFDEPECKTEYMELRRQCQKFAVDLLSQTRSSQELAIILNHNPNLPPEDREQTKLARLELAILYKQKKFVAHPNIQQLLSTMWYEGLPGFRRKPLLEKCWEIVKVIWLFPFYCLLYMLLPETQTGRLMRKPFMKFLIHAASYLFFLLILILVSQRADVVAIQLLGTESMRAKAEESLLRQRGNGPSFLEYVVIIYVLGFIWEEALEMYKEGLHKYLRNMWNFIDCTRNFMYILTFALRVVAYVQQKREIALDPATAYIPRERWDAFDPQLVAEGLFAAANVLSALKLVHLFSINPHLGPLQISLGRMIIDIVKFFFIYTLVLFAFACGINQLMWYFAELERKKCYSLPGEMPDWMNNADSCTKWRTFGNLFESSQSLFWASFGGVGIDSFELSGIKSYTRFFGLLMFGSYSVINVIVLLNLLIAMMSNSYSLIEEHSDSEWKFARTKLWMSYFEDSATLPPPFNILPNLKFILKACRLRNKDKLCKKSSKGQSKERGANEDYLHCAVMRALVWRYVSVMHRHADEDPVTEDHINEVKGEVSAAKCEILEVLQRNGMDVTSADRKEKTILGRKMKMWERRLMKDFHVAPVTPSEELDSVLSEKPPVTEKEQPLARFQRVARSSVSKSANANEMWGQVVESASIASQIGRSSSRNSWTKRQNLQRAMDEAKRLVSKSPRNCRETVPSPVPEDDSTLIDLLRDFEKEIGPRTPMRDQQQKDASSQGNEGSDDMNHRIYLSVQNLAEATGECDDKTASRRSEKEKRRRSLGAPETNKDAVNQGQGQDQCNSQGQCRAIPERPTSPSPSPTPSSKPNVQFSVSVIDPTPSPKRHISRTQLEDPHDSSNPSLKSNLLPPKVIKKKGSAGGCPEGDKNIERIHRPRSPKNIQAPLPPSLIPRPGQPSSPDVRLTPPTHPSPYPLELDVKNQATRPSAPLNASTEYLIPRSSPSPEPLKPGKRIVDVSTIERPAKASWM